MRIRHALLGAATVAALAACGTSTASTQGAAPTSTTTTTTAEPTTTTTTTTRPTTTTTVEPTTTRPTTTTTKPRPTTTTTTEPVGLAEGTPCKATARACIDLSANKSWLIAGGKAVYGPVPITHGRPGWETPPGMFEVGWKSRHHRSRLFNGAPMPYSVFFNGGIAFHEGSLTEESHGCIHLSPAAAAKYFEALKVGDLVQVVR
ncbi:L,D-transpeptidase [Actinokineospora soli]|uniref:L,D-transpeptidase n=1 Tax=Actinokineospora soli TaxID=1048753 RepID=A0ABW2TIX2_9PSEU